MDNVDRHFCVDDLVDKRIKTLVKFLLIFTCDDLDMFYEVREVETDEIEARISLNPLLKNKDLGE